MAEYWGIHALFDCKACDKELIGDERVLRAFLKELVVNIDMVAYGEPILAHFATHDPSKGGYTICQMIETSLIDGHFVDENGDAYISVHSCKPFEVLIVEETINKYFKPENISKKVFYRLA